MRTARCTVKMTIEVSLADELLDENTLTEDQLCENIEAATDKFTILDFRDIVIDEIR